MRVTEGRDPLRRRRWLMVVVVLISGLAVGAIYKWVDQQGRVQYSDRPPAGQKADVVEVAPSPTPEQQQVATEKLEELTAESAAISERLAEEGVRRQTTRATVEREDSERHDACVEALEQRAVLDLARPIYRREAIGPGRYERIFISDAERVSEKARLDELIASNCSEDATARRSERAAALQLELGRQPWCVEMREAAEEYASLKTADARERLAALEEEMAQTHAQCPEVGLDDVWLAQRQVVWRRHPPSIPPR